MESYGREVGAYLSGDSGLEHSRATGIRAMRNWPDKGLNSVYYFLTDEPDAHDYAVKQLQPNQRLGALGSGPRPPQLPVPEAGPHPAPPAQPG